MTAESSPKGPWAAPRQPDCFPACRLLVIICGWLACLLLSGCQDVAGDIPWEVVTPTLSGVARAPSTAKPELATPPPATDDLEAAPIDSAVLELAALINLARIDAGVAELEWSLELEGAAVLHAQDMSNGDFVSHTGSDGSDLVTRMRRAGYDPAWRGEIIAQVMGGPEEALRWWWDSQLHRETMLGEAYRDFGVGRAAQGKRAGWYNYVVVFGRR